MTLPLAKLIKEYGSKKKKAELEELTFKEFHRKTKEERIKARMERQKAFSKNVAKSEMFEILSKIFTEDAVKFEEQQEALAKEKQKNFHQPKDAEEILKDIEYIKRTVIKSFTDNLLFSSLNKTNITSSNILFLLKERSERLRVQKETRFKSLNFDLNPAWENKEKINKFANDPLAFYIYKQRVGFQHLLHMKNGGIKVNYKKEFKRKIKKRIPRIILPGGKHSPRNKINKKRYFGHSEEHPVIREESRDSSRYGSRGGSSRARLNKKSKSNLKASTRKTSQNFNDPGKKRNSVLSCFRRKSFCESSQEQCEDINNVLNFGCLSFTSDSENERDNDILKEAEVGNKKKNLLPLIEPNKITIIADESFDKEIEDEVNYRERTKSALTAENLSSHEAELGHQKRKKTRNYISPVEKFKTQTKSKRHVSKSKKAHTRKQTLSTFAKESSRNSKVSEQLTLETLHFSRNVSPSPSPQVSFKELPPTLNLNYHSIEIPELPKKPIINTELPKTIQILNIQTPKNQNPSLHLPEPSTLSPTQTHTHALPPQLSKTKSKPKNSTRAHTQLKHANPPHKSIKRLPNIFRSYQTSPQQPHIPNLKHRPPLPKSKHRSKSKGKDKDNERNSRFLPEIKLSSISPGRGKRPKHWRDVGKIDRLIRGCVEASLSTRDKMRQVRNGIEKEAEMTQSFNQTIERLQELDFATTATLKNLYDDKVRNNDQTIEEVQEVLRDYRNTWIKAPQSDTLALEQTSHFKNAMVRNVKLF